MNGITLNKVDDKHLRLSGIDWVAASCLLEVPSILSLAKSGPAHDRLFQKVSASDPALNEDWLNHVTPELGTLFAEAGEILAKDIELFGTETKSLKPRALTFSIAHLNAWMSALNQARLILGAQHDVTESDMDEREFSDPDNPKQQAVLRIHVLGYLVQVFVEFVSGET
ncbi:MAG: DUF2017 family protein [Verrucomicrobiae bacterium]|nr:DUF2017 family protein [Verrucomicrobiae bacterium]